MIQPSGSGSVFWWNGAFEAVKASEVEEADEINEDAEVLGPEKSLLRTSEVFQVLESNILRTLFWCFEKKIFWQNLKNSYWILSSLLSEAVEAVWGQNKFIWLIRHKFPILRKSLSISFWYICQNIWSSQVFTLSQFLMVDPVWSVKPIQTNYVSKLIERHHCHQFL